MIQLNFKKINFCHNQKKKNKNKKKEDSALKILNFP